GSQCKFRFQVIFKVFFESINKSPQRFLLAANKSKRWVFFRRVVRRKEDTVEQHSRNWFDGTLQSHRYSFCIGSAKNVCSCRGETVLSPVVGTGLKPLISASTVSLEVQAN